MVVEAQRDDIEDGGYSVEPGFIPVSYVTVSPKSADLEINTALQLTVTVMPTNATSQDVIWSTSDNLVATVDSTGQVTGISAGTAIITVTM